MDKRKAPTNHQAELKPTTLNQYQEAVKHLLNEATLKKDTSQGAALVLLSLYDWDNFQTPNIMALNLDPVSLDAALTASKGRWELNTKVQDIIEDGPEAFKQLWYKWHHLSINHKE